MLGYWGSLQFPFPCSSWNQSLRPGVSAAESTETSPPTVSSQQVAAMAPWEQAKPLQEGLRARLWARCGGAFQPPCPAQGERMKQASGSHWTVFFNFVCQYLVMGKCSGNIYLVSELGVKLPLFTKALGSWPVCDMQDEGISPWASSGMTWPRLSACALTLGLPMSSAELLSWVQGSSSPTLPVSS